MTTSVPTTVPPDTRIITLPRSGTRPLCFKGQLVSEAVAAKDPSRKTVRWHEIRLYRTETGKFVLQIQLKTDTRFEQPFDEVFILDNAEHVVETLEDYDPCHMIVGWPAHYPDKNARLRDSLESAFEVLVSQILVGDEFAERV